MRLCEYLDSYKGKSVAVVGAGISNMPLIKLLLSAGIDVTIHDIKTEDMLASDVLALRALGARFVLGAGYLDDIAADAVFRTPGVMPWHPGLQRAVLNGAVLTSEMEAFFDVCPCKIIAVTGSDGKTTTTSIIADILKRAGYTVHVGGNIGTPLLERADEIREDDLAVLELSSFQLISMRKSPDIAVITNITPNHLNVHRDMEEYVRSKTNIFLHQSVTGVTVMNYDNEITRELSLRSRGESRLFSRCSRVSNGMYLRDGVIVQTDGGTESDLMPVSEIRIPGLHNVENFMAAFLAVREFVTHDVLCQSAREFNGVAHRMELIRELRGVCYYNDSIASSPTRAIAGFHTFDRKVILIAGGKDKGIEFDEFGSEVVEHVKLLVLTGHAAGKIREAVVNAKCYDGVPEIIMREDFTEAVKTASESAGFGDIVLLSPACTSFDMFSNFEERGNTFRTIIKELE